MTIGEAEDVAIAISGMMDAWKDFVVKLLNIMYDEYYFSIGVDGNIQVSERKH